LRTPADDADLGVALVVALLGHDQRPAAIAEAGILAAGRPRGADLGIADDEIRDLERFVNRLAFLWIDHLDIDLMQLARRLQLLVGQQLLFRHGLAPGHDIDGILECLEVPDRAPAGDGHCGARGHQGLLPGGIGEVDRRRIRDRLLELDQRQVGLLAGDVAGMHDDFLALDLFRLGAIVAAIVAAASPKRRRPAPNGGRTSPSRWRR